MNKFLKVVAVAAAGLAAALLVPAQAWAACPGGVGISSCLTAGGGAVAPGAVGFGGTYWIPGAGLDVIGFVADPLVGGGTNDGGIYGTDAGTNAGFPLALSPGLSFVTDYDSGGAFFCLAWDWGSFGSDGCANGTDAMTVVLRDDQNRFALMQVAGSGALYDFDSITNGITGPQGGTGNGVPLGRAVHAVSAGDLGLSVQVDVAPLTIVSYDDQGGIRAVPGTPRLRGLVGAVSTVVATGAGGGSVSVDADSDLCWELVDAGYTATLGCLRVGGDTPSQNVINGKAGFAKGGASFSWDVTAQFDVLGFNIYQKNVSKGNERQINDGLIPISGDNDATAESYKYLAPRSDLRAWKGGFEIELVRQNGETSRSPVTIAK